MLLQEQTLVTSFLDTCRFLKIWQHRLLCYRTLYDCGLDTCRLSKNLYSLMTDITCMTVSCLVIPEACCGPYFLSHCSWWVYDVYEHPVVSKPRNLSSSVISGMIMVFVLAVVVFFFFAGERSAILNAYKTCEFSWSSGCQRVTRP